MGDIMEYDFVSVSRDKLDILVNYKLDTIITDDSCIANDEKNKIINYVSSNCLKRINDSRFVILDKKIIGCVILYPYEDGVLLDELYLVQECRGLKIGTSILSNIIENYKIVYLWVYKNNNKAFRLYTKMNFKIIDETETRYFMRCLHS